MAILLKLTRLASAGYYNLTYCLYIVIYVAINIMLLVNEARYNEVELYRPRSPH